MRFVRLKSIINSNAYVYNARYGSLSYRYSCCDRTAHISYPTGPIRAYVTTSHRYTCLIFLFCLCFINESFDTPSPRRPVFRSGRLLTRAAAVIEIQRGHGQGQEQGRQEHAADYDGQVAFHVRPPLPPRGISKTKGQLRSQRCREERPRRRASSANTAVASRVAWGGAQKLFETKRARYSAAAAAVRERRKYMTQTGKRRRRSCAYLRLCFEMCITRAHCDASTNNDG